METKDRRGNWSTKLKRIKNTRSVRRNTYTLKKTHIRIGCEKLSKDEVLTIYRKRPEIVLGRAIAYKGGYITVYIFGKEAVKRNLLFTIPPKDVQLIKKWCGLINMP